MPFLHLSLPNKARVCSPLVILLICQQGNTKTNKVAHDHCGNTRYYSLELWDRVNDLMEYCTLQAPFQFANPVLS